MASGPKAFLRVGAVVLGVLALVVQGEVAGQTASDLSVVRAVEDYRLGQLDQAKTALERSLQGRLSETDRGVALVSPWGLLNLGRSESLAPAHPDRPVIAARTELGTPCHHSV